MRPILERLRGQLTENDFVKLPKIIALVIVTLGILLSYIFADRLAREAKNDFVNHSKQQAAIMSVHLNTQMRAYEQILLDTAGMFGLSQDNNISRDQWHSFVDYSNIIDRYPEVLGIGFAQNVTEADLPAHIDGMRSQGMTEYTVFPAEPQRQNYIPIIYLEPFNTENIRAVGYDMFSEPNRKRAMEQARDTGLAQMSDPVHLVQDGQNQSRLGVLVFCPVYIKGVDPKTVDSRRASLVGFTYIAIRPADMVASIDKTTIDLKEISYELTDSDQEKVTASHTFKPAVNTFTDTQTVSIQAPGQVWELKVDSYQSTFQRLTGPGVLLLMGTVLSSIFGYVIFRLLNRILQTLITTHEESLMQTKSELIALASHQLRTPASGVKQYLGILTEGFMGELTSDQQAIAEKAYRANEHQLEIINELLHVAKADAGQLSLQIEEFDIVPVIYGIVDGALDQAEAKDITVSVSAPQSCMVSGDERYLRMLVENLLSNAIKYSPNDRTIMITVSQTARVTRIAVKDEGVGIAEEDIEKLFIKFNRIENPLSRQEGGTGLGLFLARHIARAHKGNITVMSRPGEGSTFTLSLPRKYNNYRKRSI